MTIRDMKTVFLFPALLLALAGCDLIGPYGEKLKEMAYNKAIEQESPLPLMGLAAAACAASIPREVLTEAPIAIVQRLQAGELVTPACSEFFTIADNAKEDHVLPLVQAIAETDIANN